MWLDSPGERRLLNPVADRCIFDSTSRCGASVALRMPASLTAYALMLKNAKAGLRLLDPYYLQITGVVWDVSWRRDMHYGIFHNCSLSEQLGQRMFRTRSQ